MKNIRLMAALTALLLIPATAHPMGQAFRSKFTKDNFKKGFNYACKATNIGLTFGPMWLTAGGLLIADPAIEKGLEMYPDNGAIRYAHKDITKLTQEQLKAVGVSNHNTIPIVEINSPNPAMASARHVFIGENIEAFDAIEKYYAGIPLSQTEKEALNNYKGMCQHEGNHIKNKDTQNATLISFSLPALTHYSFKAASTLLGLHKLNALGNIGAGLFKYEINTITFSAYRRFCEQRADNQTVDDKDILQSNLNYFKKHEADEQEGSQNKNIFQKKYAELHSTHPTTTHRIAKLEQRLAVLKSQEQTTEQK